MDGNVFQTGLLIVFGALAAAGFAFFAFFQPEPEGDVSRNIGAVQIWGTVDREWMEPTLKELETLFPRNHNASVTYEQFDERTYHEELVDALASGTGPDIAIIKHKDLWETENKSYSIPFEQYSVRRFRDTYIEGSELLIGDTGILGFPFIVDPLIMYWNRDLLNREGVAVVPEYWDEFFTLSPKLTKVDSRANVLQATVPFGEYANVDNAKEIISALFLQSEVPITNRDVQSGLRVELAQDPGRAAEETNNAESALRFYTEFSNPVKSVYSWNRALDDSRTVFVGGDLAFYFGFASEIDDISRANPNLNFDIAPLPQIRDDITPATFADIYSLNIMNASDNLGGAVTVAALLSTDRTLSVLSESSFLPPVSRTLLAKPPIQDIDEILYESALISFGWLEPDSARVDVIFKDMIESISSGRLRIQEAIADAQLELKSILEQ